MSVSQYQELSVQIHDDADALGAAAAQQVGRLLGEALETRGSARVILATGNSQLPMIRALRSVDLDWSRISVFHMDEYIGIDADHPASFRRWMRENVEEVLKPGAMHYIDGNADPRLEAMRYEELLRSKPLDLVCMGIGENGHLAFNEPGVAEFDTEQWCTEIQLTEESIQQQVGEGHFPTPEDVPSTALSLTIPALLATTHQVVCTPEARKAEAVRRALTGPVTRDCPASILQHQSSATLHLDRDSAALLN